MVSPSASPDPFNAQHMTTPTGGGHQPQIDPILTLSQKTVHVGGSATIAAGTGDAMVKENKGNLTFVGGSGGATVRSGGSRRRLLLPRGVMF
jgi:hypothetical protein